MALRLSAADAKKLGVPLGKAKPAKRAKTTPTKGELAANAVTAYCRMKGYPLPTAELRFHSRRKWRFDLAWSYHHFRAGIMTPELLRVAVEFQGGNWTGGAHTRGKHFESDCRKFSTAASLGWRVMLMTYDMLERGELWPLLDEVFAQ